MPETIDLKIERLVLKGFHSQDRHGIGMAVEQELVRLLAENSVPTSLTQPHEILQLTTAMFEVPQGCKAEIAGTQIARTVYSGLSQ